LDDLIVGAYTADPSSGANAGKSYVVFGHNIRFTYLCLIIPSTHNQIIQAIAVNIACAGD
jgi:hypothetical protein